MAARIRTSLGLCSRRRSESPPGDFHDPGGTAGLLEGVQASWEALGKEARSAPSARPGGAHPWDPGRCRNLRAWYRGRGRCLYPHPGGRICFFPRGHVNDRTLDRGCWLGPRESWNLKADSTFSKKKSASYTRRKSCPSRCAGIAFYGRAARPSTIPISSTLTSASPLSTG